MGNIKLKYLVFGVVMVIGEATMIINNYTTPMCLRVFKLTTLPLPLPLPLSLLIVDN
jgi:hypothetical protein